MEEKKIEGLLLQATPYLGSQKILTILTPSDGLIKVIAKNKSLEPLTRPFLIAEWVYLKGRSEIYFLKDASLLNDLGGLRKSYELITIAGKFAQDLLKSQWPEKPGSGPYSLAIAYLQKLASSCCPETLLASFRLKLLLHEGHLGEQEFPIPLSIEEQKLVHDLTFARQFHVLQSLKIEKTLQDKIDHIFHIMLT